MNAEQGGPATPGFLNLTGQRKAFLVNQIKAFRDTRRWTPIKNSDLIGTMTDENIEAVATCSRYLKVKT